MTSRAEALVVFSGKPRDGALAVLNGKPGISFEHRSGSVRILAVSGGSHVEAMTAAALAEDPARAGRVGHGRSPSVRRRSGRRRSSR